MQEDMNETYPADELEGGGRANGPDLQQQLEDARNENEQLKDKYLRSIAELDNYRKRVAREREQQNLRARIDIIRQLLPVADDFALALSHVPEEYESLPWIEGLTLIYRKLETFLRNIGLEPISALGRPFDPRFHDALVSEANGDYPEGTVIGEIRKGYMLEDEIVRPTLVKVSAGPAAGSQAGEDAEDSN